MNDDDLCHLCDGQRPKMDDCPACFGRGRITEVGFLDRGWDEVAPGLFVGGHDSASYDGEHWFEYVDVKDEFDLVVSLFRRRDHDHGPSAGVEHLRHSLPDAELFPEDAERLEELAELIANRLEQGQQVLVRCQAGLNRSAFLAALVLMARGATADGAIDAIRAARSPMCLFNRSFTTYLRSRPALRSPTL